LEFRNKIAVVTGANRGIGLEIVRQLAEKGCRVILSARDIRSGEEKADRYKAQGLDVIFRPLDVRSGSGIAEFVSYIAEKMGRIDILINNAAILIDDQQSVLKVSADDLRLTLETNLIGPLNLCQAIIPLMKKHNFGRIINISSQMGALKSMGGHSPSYRISKTALNALTRIIAAELNGTNILVDSMCPGWVRTDMGGLSAPRTLKQGADTAVWLAALPDNGPSGKFFRDRHEISW